ncbi:MAG: prolyl oligopeptidase family serine peptidase [Anaerolineae bacterium]
MTPSRIAPYGSWTSPITAYVAGAAAAVRRLGDFQIAADGGDVYWTEPRPHEGGRMALVRRRANGRIETVTPDGFNIRDRVHEYGGGAFAVSDGVIIFSNFADNRLYRQEGTAAPRPVTAAGPWHFADMQIDRTRQRLICIREDHSTPGEECSNTLVSVDLDGDEAGAVLASGADFYSSPALDSAARRLAWLQWNHPQMPWTETELWLADVAPDGTLANARQIAGGHGESILQPRWLADGTLVFISDRTDWWNLYCWRDGAVTPLHPIEAEVGVPPWVMGVSTYASVGADHIAAAYNRRGMWSLGLFPTNGGPFTPVDTPYTEITSVHGSDGRAVFAGAAPAIPPSVVVFDIAADRLDVLYTVAAPGIDETYLPTPEPVEFATDGGRTAHAFFYAPHNPGFAAPEGERPPLIVISHGGPTGATTAVMRPDIAFWTSRGFAVLDVNYGGSAGFGRAYRDRLNGQWGIVDVADCANGALAMAAQGRADPDRLIIRGGSAGGYTTLAALTFTNVFKAGASYYGIGDLEGLAQDTHKFESRYLDGLVAPYPAGRDVYVERSPVHFTERLSCPVIFFQGLDDKVVPPNQAEAMVKALRRKGLPVAYLAFEGEGHGFRRADTNRRALDAELYFYAHVFDIPLSEDIEGVEIQNLGDGAGSRG